MNRHGLLSLSLSAIQDGQHTLALLLYSRMRQLGLSPPLHEWNRLLAAWCDAARELGREQRTAKTEARVDPAGLIAR